MVQFSSVKERGRELTAAPRVYLYGGVNIDPAANIRRDDLVNIPSDYHYISGFSGRPEYFNPVSHYSYTSSVRMYDDFDYHGSHMTIVSYFPTFVRSSNSPFAVENLRKGALGSVVTDALLSGWAMEAYTAFHDQIPTSFSLGNFLYELKDLKGMIPKIERSFSKTASSNFLAFEFGIKPFLGDVQKMTTLLDTVTKRLQHLRDTVGRVTPLSFSRKIIPPTENESFQLTEVGWDSPSYVEFKRLSYQGTFRVTGKLFQNLEGLNDSLSELKALAAATGFNNPAAIIWEAIPYSFVVDWFFKVQNSLSAIAIQPFGGEWTQSQIGYSIKEESVWGVYQNIGSVANRNIGQMTMKRYERRTGLPASSVFLTDGSLTPKQLVLSLALLNQRR